MARYCLPSPCLTPKNRKCIKFYNGIDLTQFFRLNKYTKYEMVARYRIRTSGFRTKLLIPLHARQADLSSHTTYARCSTAEELSLTKMAIRFIDSKSIIWKMEY
jgi:hypothetical protein